jgi:hypothetical protein
MNTNRDIDFFDTSDIVAEFDKMENNSHCYAYLTVDIYRAVCRFCFDMKISTPSSLKSLKKLKGQPIIFSESIYSPKHSKTSGKVLYEEMVDYFKYYQPESLYGFIDCRLKDNSGEKLINFYNKIKNLSVVKNIETLDDFIIKEQKTCYS